MAISDFSVGIDVEDTDNEGNALRFARFFTESEKKEIENGISPIEIWTKKEALFKYLKNDDISFISIDTTKAHNHCETIHLDDAILSIYTEANEKITIQKL